MKQQGSFNCKLADTKYCMHLNMPSCESCPVALKPKTLDRIVEEIDVYETLLPKGGIAQLFRGTNCRLCKREPAGARAGYAVVYMAHPEPKPKQSRLLPKRNPFGTVIPVQFAVCASCYRRIRLINRLPFLAAAVAVAAAVVISAVTLPNPASADLPTSFREFVPFLVILAAAIIGYLAGKAISKIMEAKAQDEMYLDVREEPVIREMIRMGWMPLEQKKGRPDMLLSRRRIETGLGSSEQP